VIARTALRRETPALRAAFLGRDARLAADDRRLAEYQSAPPPEPLATPHGDTPPGDTSPESPATPQPPAPQPAVPPAASVTPESGASAAVFSIRPPAGSPAVSRLATDGRLLQAAFESGRAATHAAFSPSTS
jgi:hypothetical protein